jgi:mediator of RNA polymerase II transcription subunit 14
LVVNDSACATALRTPLAILLPSIPTTSAKIESIEREKGEDGVVGGVLEVAERESLTDRRTMPGAIMENGDGLGQYTNHDRHPHPNGVNGGGYMMEKGQDRGKERIEHQQKMTTASPAPSHGLNGTVAETLQGEVFLNPPEMQERISQLPPEIAHITQGYMSLSTLLKRLSVRTHEDLKRKILDLSQMPIPSSALNTNGSHITSTDDNSAENLSKKLLLLNLAQSTHADWVKALVITNWSRRSEDVSKTIDLKIYLDQRKTLYDLAIHEMSEVKRSLPYARVPNPDLKTALQVLSTGKAPWMPEVCLTGNCEACADIM